MLLYKFLWLQIFCTKVRAFLSSDPMQLFHLLEVFHDAHRRLPSLRAKLQSTFAGEHSPENQFWIEHVPGAGNTCSIRPHGANDHSAPVLSSDQIRRMSVVHAQRPVVKIELPAVVKPDPPHCALVFGQSSLQLFGIPRA